MQGDDGCHPNKCPLLPVDIFVVEIFIEVECEEYGPEYREGPYVSLEVDGQRVVQTCGADLVVVHQFRSAEPG